MLPILRTSMTHIGKLAALTTNGIIQDYGSQETVRTLSNNYAPNEQLMPYRHGREDPPEMDASIS